MNRNQFVIYVAGPFRSRKNTVDQWEQTQNIRRAEEASLEVWKRGHVALCPHLNTAHFQGAVDDDVWLRGGLALLERCDGVLLVEGWEKSEGVCREARRANELNQPAACDLSALIRKLSLERGEACYYSSETPLRPPRGALWFLMNGGFPPVIVRAYTWDGREWRRV